MNKRITSILLCFVMVFTMLATAVPALAVSPTPFYIDPDKTEAHPGDTITYTVKMGSIEGMGGLLLEMNIPEGLEYISGSGKDAEGIASTLNAIIATYTDLTHIFNVGMSNYTGSGEIALFSFQCKVKDGVSGNISVTFADIEVIDGDEEDIPYDISNLRSTVMITAAPKPATGITLNKSTLELTVGASETLVATVEPADTTDTISWDTGRSDVATVDSTGKVTAVGSGTAVIAARAGEKSAFCTVTVVAAPCTHTNKTNVPAQTSTCVVKGWSAYSKCNDCGQLFDSEGNKIDEIPYLPLSTTHTEGEEWKYNDTQHWHECTVVGCGTVIETSRANHSGGTATCQNKAVCATCNQPYGTLGEHDYGTLITQVNPVHTPEVLTDGTAAHYKCSVCNKLFNESKVEVTAADLVIPAAHTFGTEWKYNDTQHWHECTCGAKEDIAAHSFQWVVDTPATEETTGVQHEECECGKTRSEGTAIPKLDHTHNWIETPAKPSTCLENGNNQYFYCTKCEKYFKSDKATETTVEAETLSLADHTPLDKWSYDSTNHWKVCAAGCGTIIEGTTEAHIPDREAATETEPVTCTKCGYEIAPALGMKDYFLEMPVMVGVKLTGDEKPGKETFKLEIYDCKAEVEILNDTLTAEDLEFVDGGANFDGMLKIKVKGLEQLSNITEGFKVRMVKGTAKGWTYATEQWSVTPVIFEGATTSDLSFGYDVCQIIDGEISEVAANCMSFTLGYEAEKDQTPKTGDSSNMLLWAALLLAGGLGTFGTVAYSKKRKEDAE